MITLEEAKKIAEILSTADGECNTCFKSLSELMQHEFSEFDWYELGKKDKEKVEKVDREFIKGTFGTTNT